MFSKVAVNFLILLLCIDRCLALQCRAENSFLESDLKGVVRTCMRKIAENLYRKENSSPHTFSNMDKQLSGNNYYNFNTKQQNQQDFNYRNNRDNGYNNSYPYDSYHDFTQQGVQLKPTISSYNYWNANERVISKLNGNNSEIYPALNHFVFNEMNGDKYNSTFNTSCVAHCFFDEMNMLNNDYYPDKDKINYMFVSSQSDLELRSFYADTIEKCFHFMSYQQRTDKCIFARDIVQCLLEYAKKYCEDFNQFNMNFN